MASLIACSLFHPLSRRSLTRSVVRWLVLSVTRSPGRPFARSLGRPVPPSLDRSAARSSARLVARALVTSLSCFLVRSFARLLACERWLARLLVRFPARSFTFALMSSRASVRSFARARSLVPAFARLLGRSFGRPLVFLVARSPIRSVALSLIRLLIERGFASHSAVYAFHHKLD